MLNAHNGKGQQFDWVFVVANWRNVTSRAAAVDKETH